MAERTFTIIKPDAVSAGHTGKILDMIASAGFRLRAIRMVMMSREKAESFYAIHKGKPFFDKLIAFMTSGPAIVAVLEKDNAVADLRKLVGNTNPELAEKGTIRNTFGTDNTRNSIHAADSIENAKTELSQFFSPDEVFNT